VGGEGVGGDTQTTSKAPLKKNYYFLSSNPLNRSHGGDACIVRAYHPKHVSAKQKMDIERLQGRRGV